LDAKKIALPSTVLVGLLRLALIGIGKQFFGE
jgi:hypothetical protein